MEVCLDRKIPVDKAYSDYKSATIAMGVLFGIALLLSLYYAFSYLKQKKIYSS